jgi:putative ABC transport system substrate-binding protein
LVKAPDPLADVDHGDFGDSRPARGQTTDRLYRLGALALSAGFVERMHAYILPALAREGFAEGRNWSWRSAPGPPQSFRRWPKSWSRPSLTRSSPMAQLPFVRSERPLPLSRPLGRLSADPIAAGFAASLARPGGNITGVVMLAPELDAKRLDLFHQVVLTARRVAVLGTSATQSEENLAAVREVAEALGLDLVAVYAEFPAEYPAAFAVMRSAGAERPAILSAPDFFINASTLAALALEARLPTVCEWRKMADQGCLLGYGPDIAELNRRIANYVARIFRGAFPGDLPMEQPTHFELAVNLKTAKALGLAIPPAILARADDVIE